MCRNKKAGWILLLFAAAIGWQACTVPAKLMSDTGSSGKEEIAREEYLNVDALSGQSGQVLGGQYTIYTLTRETFTEEALSQKLKREYINTTEVYVDLETLNKLERYEVEYFDYVEAGDVLATFRVTIDQIAVEEAQKKLQRLQEQYQRAVQDREEEVKEQEKERKELLLELEKKELSEECYEMKDFDVRLEQSELTWEYERQKMEQEMEDVQRTIDKLLGSGAVYQLKSPVAGYVIFKEKYGAGSSISNGSYFCDILNGEDYYVKVERQGELFGYGMQLAFDTPHGNKTGRVVSAGSMALYGNLNTDEAFIALDMEGITQQELQSNSKNITLQGSLKTVHNVLLVPKQAVTEEKKEYFVTVLKEDGSLLKTEFIPGGSNTDYYWVMDGLEEGMQIIYR